MDLLVEILAGKVEVMARERGSDAVHLRKASMSLEKKRETPTGIKWRDESCSSKQQLRREGEKRKLMDFRVVEVQIVEGDRFILLASVDGGFFWTLGRKGMIPIHSSLLASLWHAV